MSATSPFYPPRHKGWGRFRGIRFLVSRLLNAPFLEMPKGAGYTLSGYLLPCVGFDATGFKALFLAALAAYLVALVVYIVFLGFAAASWAFVAMMTIHVVGASFFHRQHRGAVDLKERIEVAILILIGASLLYAGFQFVLQKWALPVRFQNRVFVTNRLHTKLFHRGDWIVYAVHESWIPMTDRHGTYRVLGGYNLGKILAVPGDTVKFGTNDLCVNGISFARNPDMPTTGELIVPKKSWFIWPDFVVSGNGPASNVLVQEMLVRQGIVSQDELVGKVFRRWFFRKQL